MQQQLAIGEQRSVDHFGLSLLEAHLRVLEDLEEERTIARIPFALRDDFQACRQKLRRPLAHNEALIPQRYQNVVEDHADVGVEVVRGIARQFLQDKHASVPRGLWLLWLHQVHRRRHLLLHEALPEGGPADLSNLAEGFRRLEHEVEVMVREEVLDVVVEAEKVPLGLDGFLSVDVQEVICAN